VTLLAEVARRAAGRFIVLEGIDGSGTTTQAQALVAGFEGSGSPARFTHEPSKGPVGRLLRDLLVGNALAPSLEWDGMALLFAADRLEHVAREIRPALSAGVAVICDRYDLSSLAYQSATAPAGEAPVPWLRAINQQAPRPDLTLVLNVPADLAASRRARRGEPEELFEHGDLQRRLAEIYAHAEELVPGDRLVHVRADDTIEAVQAEVLRAIALAFPG
jgi:dTMP kinase